jgi:hypothetical protein
MSSPFASREGDQIGLEFHLGDPLSNWSIYRVLLDGLGEAKAAYHEARVAHDDVRAAELLAAAGGGGLKPSRHRPRGLGGRFCSAAIPRPPRR